MSEAEIRRVITALADLTAVIKDADPQDKARIYAGLNLRLGYQPAQRIVRAEVNLDSHGYGAMGRVRGATRTETQRHPSLDGTVLLLSA